MVLDYKSCRYPSLISHSLKTDTARGIKAFSARAKALQYARVKRAALLAAISALAFLSALCTVGFSATSAPVIYFFPDNLSFASRPIGTTSAAQSISVIDRGGGTLQITSVAITGTNAGDFAQTNTCGSSVGVKRCTISVTFTPTASGSRSASLSITDNASGSPQTIALSGTGTGTTLTPAATPTFSIPPGTYSSAQTVTISDTTAGATIYYTTNGSTPTASTQYTGAITVSSTETIEAIATASGYSTSPVATATYTITPPAATPSFSPASGTYTSAQTVTISDATSGATIYYTTNGSTPTTASTQYTGAITVSSSETIEAIATASGYSTSPVATATYTISLAVVSLSPTSLAFGSQPIDVTSAAQTITLSNGSSAALSITGLTITGTNASDFTQTNTCGSSLAAGGNCTIEVMFTASHASAESATLSITDNASGSPQTAICTGTGIPDVILSWGASPSSGVVGYNVYRGTTSGGESSTPLNSTPINGPSYVDTNVTAGVTYYYYVTAVGTDGVQSAPSGETEATVPTS